MKMIGSLFCALGKSLGVCEYKLVPVGELDLQEMASIILDKLEAIGDTDRAALNFADSNSRLYKEADVVNFLKLVKVDKITFVAEDMDCDNFAGMLYGEFSKQRAFPGGIVDTYIHRLNWFINENLVFKFIEPQTRKISETLEGWQGEDIKFILS